MNGGVLISQLGLLHYECVTGSRAFASLCSPLLLMESHCSPYLVFFLFFRPYNLLMYVLFSDPTWTITDTRNADRTF